MEDHVGAPEQGSRSRYDPDGDLVHVIIHGEVFIVNPISSDQVPSQGLFAYMGFNPVGIIDISRNL
jgi:hypothetical protein